VSAIRKVHQRSPEKFRPQQGVTKNWSKSDFIWEALLVSSSTWGNARGVQLVHDRKLHKRVTYAALEKRRPSERETILRDALREAKVRRYKIKAAYLAKNFARIEADGGPARVRGDLISCRSTEAKIKFLKTFWGIGDKYARNLMMDVYHPDFRDTIALDVRINKFLTTLQLTFHDYHEKESFFVSAAHEAGLNGWQLDRMLFKCTDEVLAALE
jgi:hypothetical protein